MQISGKVFAVTGGGNGIGRGVVLGLLARGARVAALDLREDGLEETRRLAGDGAGRLTTHRVDVTDPARVRSVADEVVAAHGRVDGLLNVAGVIQRFVPFAELDRTDVERVMAVNFWGVVNTVQSFLPLLTARPEASLVNVSSMGALAPVPGQTVYGASKAAVELFTQGLYAELRDGPVAVTVVYPGGVATQISDNSGVHIPGADAAAAEQASSLTTVDDAARQVIAGIERGSYRVVIGRDARTLDLLSRLSPRRATEMIAGRMARLLRHGEEAPAGSAT